MDVISGPVDIPEVIFFPFVQFDDHINTVIRMAFNRIREDVCIPESLAVVVLEQILLIIFKFRLDIF